MAKKKSLFEKMGNIIGNEHAFYMHEENPYEIKEWIDTECYALNAVLSNGDIYKGLAKGKRYMFAGKSGTAKSLFQTLLIKNYYKSHKKCRILSFESEGATVVDFAKKCGIPPEHMFIAPVFTIKQTTTELVNALDAIIESKKAPKGSDGYDDTEWIIVLDSLGMLGTEKEISDVASGKDSKDLTKQQHIRALARMTSLKFSIAQVPFIIVNHSHTDIMSYGAPQKVSGGEGGIYMADVILLLDKFADREEEGGKKKQVGVKIKAKVVKSRFMQENKIIEILLSFKKGLYKYSNIIKWAEEFKILKKGTKDGEKTKFKMPDGRMIPMSDVRDPKKIDEVMSDDLIQAVRKSVKENFSFGDDIEDDSNDKELVEKKTGTKISKEKSASKKKTDGEGASKDS